ncbi:UNVERIFIED_CONTAM: hypothetical protein RMT77_010800 [Armadillidium vulgare]
MDITTNSDYALKEFYLGSRKFQFVADAVGLPIDQVNFILAQVLALLFAYFFRVFLHPNNVSSASRHWTALSAGLCISYFCFGKQVLLAVLLVVVCYFLLNLLPPSIFHHATLLVSITFLSVIHIERQFYEDGLFVADITGPLMIIVQKTTTLAYSLNDGMVKNISALTPLQKKYALKSKPSALEYFGYLMNFQSILAGPFFMFTDYHDYIEGTHYIRCESYKKQRLSSITEISCNNNKLTELATSTETASGKMGFHNELKSEPCSTRAAMHKTFFAFVCALSVVFIMPNFPIKYLAEPSFFASSMTYKLSYIVITTSLVRNVYYCAWFLGEAVCIMAGIGFNGYDEKGNSKWDLVSNVRYIGVEFGISLKEVLDSWNIGTMKWLRYIVYERAAKQKTLLTYLLSSLWHGFYPGYYLTFLGGAFFTIAARAVRRYVRPHILKCGSGVKALYDFLTFIATRLCLSYMVFPFVLLRFWSSIHVYNCLRYYLHVLGLLAIFILPLASPVKERQKGGSKTPETKPINGINSNILKESFESKKIVEEISHKKTD